MSNFHFVLKVHVSKSSCNDDILRTWLGKKKVFVIRSWWSFRSPHKASVEKELIVNRHARRLSNAFSWTSWMKQGIHSVHDSMPSAKALICLHASIKALVTMVSRGTNVENVKNSYFNQAALTVSQLIMFNSMICTRKESYQTLHTTKRKPPIAIYIEQLLHL